MALIVCPECGKAVSDKAVACIYCGYPLQEDAPAYLSKRIEIQVLNPAKKVKAIKAVREVTKLGLADAKKIVEQPPPVVVKDGLSQAQAQRIAAIFHAEQVDVAIVDSFTPKIEDTISCPNCGSTKCHAGARGFSIITGFVGSGETVLTCLKCGYRWKPGK